MSQVKLKRVCSVTQLYNSQDVLAKDGTLFSFYFYRKTGRIIFDMIYMKDGKRCLETYKTLIKFATIKRTNKECNSILHRYNIGELFTTNL